VTNSTTKERDHYWCLWWNRRLDRKTSGKKTGFAVVVNYAGKAAPAQSFSGGYQGPRGGQGIAVQADVAIGRQDVERLFKESMEALGRP